MSVKVSENLHQLIRSLSKPEKRYFKLHSSRHIIGEQNNYVKLFDAIDKQKEYNEGALLQLFKKEIFIKQFSIAKSRLYDSILRSLDAYNSDSSVDSQLKNMLHHAEILFKKTLYEQCIRILSSAKKLASKYEKHIALLDIYRWEKELIEKDNYSGKSEQDIKDILEQDKIVINKIKTHKEFWSVKSRFFQLLNKQGKARNQNEIEKFKKIIDTTLLKIPESELTTATKYLSNHIYSAYYFGIGDYKNSYKYLHKNVALIESTTFIFKEEPNIYFSVLTNLIYVASQLKKYSEVIKYLDKLRAIPHTLETNKNEDLEVKLFSSAYSLELTLYAQTGDFDKALKLIPKIEEGIDRYDGKINKVRRSYFYFNIAVICFGAEKYSLALRWANKLLNDSEIDESKDIYCFTQLLNLIIHIELKHDDLIPYAFKSTQRYLNSRERVYKFENLFLEFIGKIMKTKNREEQYKHYKRLRDDMKKLQNDPFEKAAFEYFDFISWAESRYLNQSFQAIVEEKAK
ncbi:MAG: hypothetical protein IPP32_03900 [Bacteroidetes bacterium]|nr:hypothetical protein [Bacteroidota bacterium]